MGYLVDKKYNKSSSNLRDLQIFVMRKEIAEVIFNIINVLYSIL